MYALQLYIFALNDAQEDMEDNISFTFLICVFLTRNQVKKIVRRRSGCCQYLQWSKGLMYIKHNWKRNCRNWIEYKLWAVPKLIERGRRRTWNLVYMKWEGLLEWYHHTQWNRMIKLNCSCAHVNPHTLNVWSFVILD